MADLYASTSLTSSTSRPGSPFRCWTRSPACWQRGATQNRRLVASGVSRMAQMARIAAVRRRRHTINDLTENEKAVFYLGLTWSISRADGDLTEEVADPEVQKYWDRLKQARATLRAVAQAGEHAQA